MKFDPTDQELIEHLEAKVEAKDMKSHPLIDEFIPTIEGEDGICYTHPEKLPGTKLNFLFFLTLFNVKFYCILIISRVCYDFPRIPLSVSLLHLS